MIIYVYNRCSFNNGCRFGFRRCLAAFRQFIQQAGKFQLPEKFDDFAPVEMAGLSCLDMSVTGASVTIVVRILLWRATSCFPAAMPAVSAVLLHPDVDKSARCCRIAGSVSRPFFPDAPDAGDIIRRVAF